MKGRINFGVPVLSKALSPAVPFQGTGIDQIANTLTARRQILANLNWPDFHSSRNAYALYYQAVLADTIQKFNYGKDTAWYAAKTQKYSALSVEELKEKSFAIQSNLNEKISFQCANMLERAKHYVASRSGALVYIPNPANEEVIGGGAFGGAPNFEEDLFRISDGGIALVEHARQHGDFVYDGHDIDIRPTYHNENRLKPHEALISTSVKIIKKIIFKENKHWYGKEFADLPIDEQFHVSIVSNAAIPLAKKRTFSLQERNETTTRIRAHLTAMISAGRGIGIFTDFGCGGFNNSPAEIAEVYAQLLLREGYIHFFDHVEFAIIVPTHLKIFKNVFDKYLTLENKEKITLAGMFNVKRDIVIEAKEQTEFEIQKARLDR